MNFIWMMALSLCCQFAQAEISYSDFSIHKMSTTYFLDSTKPSIKGSTTIDFTMSRKGRFFYQFSGLTQSVILDGKSLGGEEVRVFIPQGSNFSFTKLNRLLEAKSQHQAVINFEVDPIQYRLTNQTNRNEFVFGTRLSNMDGVGFESILPSINWPMAKPDHKIKIVLPASQSPNDYQLFSNSTLAQVSLSDGFELNFSGVPLLQIYFYLLPRSSQHVIQSFDTEGVKISVLLSADSYMIQQNYMERTMVDVQSITQRTFHVMGQLFGKYPHRDHFSVFLTGRGDSMEYRGMVVSTLPLLRHEIIHQWFATSVSPKNYSDMWLSEAITVWLRKKLFNEDESWNGVVPDFTKPLKRTMKLAGASELFGGYPRAVYSYGFGFLNLVDQILKTESEERVDLLAVLQEFYRTYKGRHFETRDFIEILKSKVKYQWDPLFDKFVFDQQSKDH